MYAWNVVVGGIEFRGDRLVNLVEKISRQPSIPSIGVKATLNKFTVENQEKNKELHEVVKNVLFCYKNNMIKVEAEEGYGFGKDHEIIQALCTGK